ncbi:hypothetical protein L596_022825 [Steinernema carpocapsae]|uniref:Uncharacterized protein n=1 Tax=Steinernema carpocapsae TaxID=34508 RepID=A0A4U5MMX7_STECR|nr:hypothetical protein L596_022825 [Steinernema carpocapsae]
MCTKFTFSAFPPKQRHHNQSRFLLVCKQLQRERSCSTPGMTTIIFATVRESRGFEMKWKTGTNSLLTLKKVAVSCTTTPCLQKQT